MLKIYVSDAQNSQTVSDLSAASLPANAIWIDMESADDAERGFVERTTGLRVPSFDALSEIETSSRLASDNGTLYLSTPALFGVATGEPQTTPIGFMLNQQRLITIRFQKLPVFETCLDRITKSDGKLTGPAIFVSLLEAMVDRAADLLERVAAELDAASHRVFRAEPAKRDQARRSVQEDADLRALLRQLGRDGDLTSKIRDGLLGLGRIVPYVETLTESWMPADVKTHLLTLRRDIASLNDFDAHLNNKIQFLLDATLGLINIEQNNIIKVLTVVSVVGVPPTFLASMYGMNFKHMPELDWDYGYPYALALMVISAIGPYLWFKFRGWL